MPTVGIVIPCYEQHIPTVERAFKSCDKADIVVIVYDGKSLPFWLGKDKLPILYTNIPMPAGISYVRNLGISTLQTDLIIPLDADDYFHEGAIDALRFAWEPNTWIYGDYTIDGQFHKAPAPGMLKRKNLAQATMCFSKADWLKAGGYNPRYNAGLEDWAFQLELNQRGIIPHKIDFCVYNWTSGGKRSEFVNEHRCLYELIEADYGLQITR